MYEISSMFHFASSLNNKEIYWCIFPWVCIWDPGKLQASEVLREQRIYSNEKFNWLFIPYMSINCSRDEEPLNGFAQVHHSIKVIVLIKRFI